MHGTVSGTRRLRVRSPSCDARRSGASETMGKLLMTLVLASVVLLLAAPPAQAACSVIGDLCVTGGQECGSDHCLAYVCLPVVGGNQLGCAD